MEPQRQDLGCRRISEFSIPLLNSTVAVLLVAAFWLGPAAHESRAKDHRVALGAEMSDIGPEAGALDDPQAKDLFAEHFDSLTAGNELKWAVVEPAEGDFNFGPSERFVRFAERKTKRFRGHTLVWHRSIPAWLAARDPDTVQGSLDPWTKPELLAVLKRHVTRVVRHYRGRIGSWDVVNEPFNDDGTLRESLFYRVIGPSYIARAFRFAHRADPRAKLFLNEYGIETENAKSDAVATFVGNLKGRGVPIDGIGSQTHIHWASGLTASQLKSNIRKLTRPGLKFEVTELDVPIGTPSQPGALEAQASQYRAVAEACLAVKRCKRITMWGLTDAYTWQPPQSIPLPFAADGSPKPAWEALQEVLR